MKFKAWVSLAKNGVHNVTLQIDGKTKGIIYGLDDKEAQEIVRRNNDEEEKKKNG